MSDLADRIRNLTWRVEEMTRRVKKRADKKAERDAKSERGPVSGEDMKILVEYWAELYHNAVGMKPALGNTRIWKGARDILAVLDLDEAKAAVAKAWSDKFFAERLREIFHVASNLNAYRVQVRPEPKKAVLKPIQMPWDDGANAHVDAAESIEEMNRKLGV